MKCIKCGNDILQSDNFCDACGAKINKTNLVVNNESNVASEEKVVSQERKDDTDKNIINSNPNENNESNDVNPFDSILDNDNNNPSIDDNSIGFHIDEDDLFVTPSTNNVESNNSFSPRRNRYFSSYKDNKADERKKKLLFAGACVICVVLIAIGVVSMSNSSTSLVCKSNEGSISIRFSDNDIISYVGDGVSYNIEEQRVILKQIGFSEYISQFNDWFISNTTGACKYDGEEIRSQARNKEDNPFNLSDSLYANYSSVTVGDDFYGRVDIPTNWTRFYDASGSDVLQYSYADVFIVSLDVIDASGYSAKEHADSYASHMKNDSSVENVSTDTVKIGKNNEYTAYQVYMYYPEFSEYLITYWFDTGDGAIHYIALEGPKESNSMKITDFLPIPKSFH